MHRFLLIGLKGVANGQTDVQTDVSVIVKTRETLHAIARKNSHGPVFTTVTPVDAYTA